MSDSLRDFPPQIFRCCIRWASRQNSNTKHALFLHICDSLCDLKILHAHSTLQDNDLAHRYHSPSANVSAIQMPHRQISNLLVFSFVTTCIYKEQMLREQNLFAFYSEHSVIIGLQNTLIHIDYIEPC